MTQIDTTHRAPALTESVAALSIDRGHQFDVSGQLDEFSGIDGIEVTQFRVLTTPNRDVAVIVADMNWRNCYSDYKLDAVVAMLTATPKLLAAAERALPTGLSLLNRNIPDDTEIPITTTMGDLRQLAAAIAEAKSGAAS